MQLDYILLIILTILLLADIGATYYGLVRLNMREFNTSLLRVFEKYGVLPGLIGIKTVMVDLFFGLAFFSVPYVTTILFAYIGLYVAVTVNNTIQIIRQKSF